VVIPDDASELDAEAAALRRELRGDARRTRVRSVLGLRNLAGRDSHSLGIPVVIMVVAVLTTLVSLFVVTWGHSSTPPVPVASAPNSAGQTPAPATTSIGNTTSSNFVDVLLLDAAGSPVSVVTLLPAVILLVDGCDCAALVANVAAAAPLGITVVPVGRTVPSLPASPANVHPLADPDSQLRTRYAANTTTASTPSAATAVLVNGSGSMQWVVSGVDSADEIIPDVQRLAGR
jgi:hypothetical protein